jgi:biotin carboxyl carrier protein
VGQTFRYTYRGEVYTIRLDRQTDGALLAEIDGTVYPVRAERTADGFRVWIDEQPPITLAAAARGQARFIALDGETFTLIREDETPRSGRRSARDPRLTCTAQMPGQVRAVMVSAGDQVQRGQPLMILEAMKMELRITAETSGRVAHVRVQVGDVVERGQTLVELTADEA